MYLRSIIGGDLKVRYFKICEVKDGTADTIKDALFSITQEAEIPMSKIIGFGSDGASVMVGCRSGVATQLKGHNPAMIALHCVAHRLALAASQAADSIPYIKNFKGHVSQIFKYYHYSAVRSASLKAIEELLDDPILTVKKSQ